MLVERGLRKHIMQALHGNVIEPGHVGILQHLPDAHELLVDVTGDPDLPEGIRVLTARVLGARRDARATDTLAAVLNEPLPSLRAAALDGLPSLMPAPHLAADTSRARVVACRHPWTSLEPIDPVVDEMGMRGRRYCAECARPVVAVDDVEALRAQLDGCALFDRRPRHSRPSRTGQVIG